MKVYGYLPKGTKKEILWWRREKGILRIHVGYINWAYFTRYVATKVLSVLTLIKRHPQNYCILLGDTQVIPGATLRQCQHYRTSEV